MAEGLLFGYDRGAFSGAVKRHRGHVECADEGTLFLDELLSLPLEGQAKLLRVLDTGEFQRLGEEAVRYSDARVIGAVQEDVERRVAAGGFRVDLYQRLGGVVIELPPLVDRRSDIIVLAAHFAAQRRRVLEPEAARELARHTWPGNVRELRLAIERAGYLVEDGTLPGWAIREAIEPRAVTRRIEGTDPAPPLSPRARETFRACEQCGWDTRQAATRLGVTRSTVYERLKGAGVSLRAFRKAWQESEFRRDSDGIPISS
jgi:DNA-binding NtrC family response regulator